MSSVVCFVGGVIATAGSARARSHCRFAPPLIHFIPDLLTYSVPPFLKRQCDRTLGLRVDAGLAGDAKGWV